MAAYGPKIRKTIDVCEGPGVFPSQLVSNAWGRPMGAFQDSVLKFEKEHEAGRCQCGCGCGGDRGR